MNITFVPMEQAHLETVLNIEERVYPQPWTSSLFESEIRLSDSRDYSVALLDGRVIGYSGLSYVDNEAHVTNIAVEPLFQGRSIASKLMLHNISLCVGRRVTNMTLEVRVSNLAAQALYRKFGFAPAGVRKGYYSHPNEDALIMWAYDIGSVEYLSRIDRIAAEVNAFEEVGS